MSTEEKEPTMDEVEKAVETSEEPEDLSKVETGLGYDTILDIMATERLDMAIAYQKLQSRANLLRASVQANKSVGNEKAASGFENELDDVAIKSAHCLRGIKAIDKEFPDAKDRMQQILERNRRTQAINRSAPVKL